MKTLVIQYQIGNCAPGWYPLWSDIDLTQEVIDEQIASCRAQPMGAFHNILSHCVVDDGLTAEESEARDRGIERSERNHCDQAYINDVRFGCGE